MFRWETLSFCMFTKFESLNKTKYIDWINIESTIKYFKYNIFEITWIHLALWWYYIFFNIKSLHHINDKFLFSNSFFSSWTLFPRATWYLYSSSSLLIFNNIMKLIFLIIKYDVDIFSDFPFSHFSIIAFRKSSNVLMMDQ